MNSLIARLSRMFYLSLCLVVVLVVLSSCSGDTSTTAAPPVWKNYRGSAFTLSYFSNWEVATKDVYLGTRYPRLEMLQGMAFVKQANATTFLQVAYAARTSKAASVKDIMLTTFLLGSSGHPAAPSSLSQITLAGETWYQGTVEKQVSQGDGSTLLVKETVLGIDRTISSNNTEIYLILYQDAAGTYSQNVHDFFTRMVKSFQFVP